PAREDVVGPLVAAPGAAVGARGLALVEALAKARGVAAAKGLGTLAEHGDAAVQEAALRAIGAIGIRAEAAVRGVVLAADAPGAPPRSRPSAESATAARSRCSSSGFPRATRPRPPSRTPRSSR